MSKISVMLVSVDEFETRVAILENRQLVEFYAEENSKPRISGNIYLGRVRDIVPGMEASFVDIGLARNAFLYVNDVLVPEADIDAAPQKIQHLLKPGQEVMVQVQKDPVAAKGARVTTQISLPGRKLVLMPFSGLVGVSKRLEDDERERLHAVAEGIKTDGMGIIVRTEAKDAQNDDLESEIKYLVKQWQEIKKKAERMEAPALVKADLDLTGRMLRDIFSAEYHHLIIDSAQKKEEVTELLKAMFPGLSQRVKLHKEKLPLFEKHNVESQLKAALKRKVWLRSGGYIAIDKIEALTGIDVNTAKYTGGKSLEQTIFKTNLEAATEIVRQIRLRDIGGIIVIDFIDLKEEGHRDELFNVLQEAIGNDRAKSRLTEISKLGLVEMTRKNISEGIEGYFYEVCPVCSTGRILSKQRAGIEVFRRMKNLVITHNAKAFVFKVAPDTAEVLEREGWLKHLMESTKKTIRIEATPGFGRDESVLYKEGNISEIEDINGL